jgi:phage terminase small subunit
LKSKGPKPPPVEDIGLTEKQKLFCKEYVIDLNGFKAACRAGYSKLSAAETASEALDNPYIVQEINRLMESRNKRLEITADHVLKELARLAFSDARRVVKWGHKGIEAVDSEDLADDDALAIAEISQVETIHGMRTKVKMYDKLGALDKLGKHLKLFSDGAGLDINFNQMGRVTMKNSADGTQKTLTFNVGQVPRKIKK